MMMDEDNFWVIVDNCRGKDSLLSQALRELPPDQIEAFELRKMELMGRAYRWDVWGAAYWLGGGCSDDSFMDFRGNLIRLGRQSFERVLADPDSLSELFTDDMFEEGFIYIAATVYKELTGKELDFKDIWKEPGYPAQPQEPAGEDWDFDDPKEMARRLPRLVRRFPDGAD